MADRETRDDDRTVTRQTTAPTRRREARRSLGARLGELASFELSTRLLREIEQSLVEQRFAAGEYLMRQGDDGDCLVVIQGGQVEISVSHDGERHVLKRGEAGEVFGEMALLTREPRTADIIALTPVRVQVLPVEEFLRIARKNPALAEVLSRLTALRLGRESHDALSGKIFHGYTIRRPLARGGMAVVYEAEEKDTARRVALKMMSHSLVFDESARQGFQREADLIESFDHENIARMFGRFEAFHTFFIVMEYCDGLPLDRIIERRKRIDVADVRRILGQLSSALKYAHERHIVHRDIKPSNVMVNRDGVVKLMDFGVARVLSEGGDVWGPITGSLPYMAPEQLESKKHQLLGTAADLYALAGLAWEMLTGRTFFDAPTLRALRKRHRAWEVPSVETELPEIDGDLKEFLSRCLVADPGERSADLDAMSSWAGRVSYDALAGS